MNEKLDIVELLMAYRRNELADHERDELEQRLANDDELRELQSLLERMDDLKQAEQDDPAARAAHMLAMQLFGDWLLQRRKAQQSNSSGDRSNTDGVRSVIAEHQPQLSVDLGQGLLTVSVLAINDENCELIGQVERLDPCPTFVECISRGYRSAADIDENGLFRFASVARGRISIIVSMPDGRSWHREFIA